MGRMMGLDVGNKTIGVAVSDLLGITAQGVKTIYRNTLDQDLKEVKDLIEEYTVDTLVIGLPKNMNGTIGPQGQKVQDFANFLKKRIKPEIIYWDERLTTIAAERTLIEGNVRRESRKQVIDKLAAVYILQSYLDYKGR